MHTLSCRESRSELARHMELTIVKCASELDAAESSEEEI
jgi:hypothetical protein